jgi:hypothetical protein
MTVGRRRAHRAGRSLTHPTRTSRMRILLIPNRRPPLPVWDVVDALGRKAAGANASTFARPLIRRCYTSSSIDVGEILHPAPPMGRAANDRSQKAHLATRIVRIVRNGAARPILLQSSAHLWASRGSSRALVRTEAALRWTAVVDSTCQNTPSAGGAEQRTLPDTGVRPPPSSCARLSFLPPVRAAQLRGVRKNSPRCSLKLAPCLSHATSDDVFSQKVSPGSPRRSPEPVAWLRRSLWLVAVWGVSDASHALASPGQAPPNSWV